MKLRKHSAVKMSLWEKKSSSKKGDFTVTAMTHADGAAEFHHSFVNSSVAHCTIRGLEPLTLLSLKSVQSCKGKIQSL